MSILRLIAASAGVAATASFAAAEVDFTASVDRTRTTRSRPVELTLSISSSQNFPQIPTPELKAEEFDVYGPSVGVRTEIVNGRVTHARELTYTLYPRREGTFLIGPATLELGGRKYSTKAVEVVVSKGGAKEDPQALEDNLFVRVKQDRRQVYAGQQVLLSYDLCYRYQLRDVGFEEVPAFSGFWTKDLFVAQRLEPQRQVIGGVAFNVVLLRKVALFPASAGEHVIEPLVIRCSVAEGRRRNSLFDAFSLFDDPFFGRGRTLLVRSPEAAVEVLPLPGKGRPREFEGAVGTYRMMSTLQPPAPRAGDPVTLTISIQGQGNIAAVGEPRLGDLEGFKQYDPKVTEEAGDTGSGYGGTKTFEYILIPEAPGALTVPPARFSFFDPDARAYRTLQTEPRELAVGGDSQESGEDSRYLLSRKEIEVVGADIRHIKPEVGELGDAGYLYRSAGFWLLQSLMPLAYAGLYFWQRHRRRLEGDVAYARRRRARGAAGRRLKTARRMLAAGAPAPDFHAEIHRAVLEFAADHLNRSAAGLEKEECAAELRRRGVPQQTVEDLGNLLQECEFARYAPGASSTGEMKRTQDRAEELMERLQKVLRG